MIYTDYGPKPKDTETRSRSYHKRNTRYNNRPYCDLCGPFRSRYLRPIGQPDDIGQEHRCRGCDEEN